MTWYWRHRYLVGEFISTYCIPGTNSITPSDTWKALLRNRSTSQNAVRGQGTISWSRAFPRPLEARVLIIFRQLLSESEKRQLSTYGKQPRGGLLGHNSKVRFTWFIVSVLTIWRNGCTLTPATSLFPPPIEWPISALFKRIGRIPIGTIFRTLLPLPQLPITLTRKQTRIYVGRMQVPKRAISIGKRIKTPQARRNRTISSISKIETKRNRSDFHSSRNDQGYMIPSDVESIQR